MDQISKHPLYSRHNIDSAISSFWSFYKKHFVALFIISLGMSLVLQYASTTIDLKELQAITDPLLLLEAMKGLILPMLIISVINLLFTTILQYYILYNPIDSESNFVVSAIRSMKYFIPYLIIMVLFVFMGAIAIFLGILALIVGVFFSILYLITLYLFILPVMIVEDTDIGHTINRTFALAHKNFWSNIGWVAVFLIILIVVSIIFSGILLLPFTGSFVKTIINPEEAATIVDVTQRPLFIILSAFVNALTLPFLPIFATIIYFNARASETELLYSATDNPENDKVKVEDLYSKPYSDEHPDNPDKT